MFELLKSLFSYETVGLCLLALMLAIPGAFVVRLLVERLRPHSTSPLGRWSRRSFVLACCLAGFVYLALGVDAFLFEPYAPVVEEKAILANIPSPLRILHLSDLHIEGAFPRLNAEKWLVQQVKALNPDLIIITGDIHQMNVFEKDKLAPALSQINAPLGVFACLGYDSMGTLRESAPQISILEDKISTVDASGFKIAVTGMTDVSRLSKLSQQIPPCDYRIAINHTPDQIDAAAQNGFDLYLCGHTHGGQVRVPFWGAVITLARTGKRYEGGWYKVGKMNAHTSRGFGVEPLPAPPVRFLCRSEITLITLTPK